MAKVNIKESLSEVLTRIRHASQRRPPELDRDVRLVAVSKTKPKELIIEAYTHGQRYFGENYVNELFEKSNDPEILETCSEIKWHFIGRLAKKQINKLLGVKNLHIWETVDNQVKADMINGSLERNFDGRSIKTMIQVNTSGEEGKNGVEPDKTGDLLQHILEKCPHLQVVGLMTIGSLEHSLKDDDLNPDFRCLIDCRKAICKRFGLDLDSFELSMGMSNDFEKAIEMGSTIVRVGSLIFGAREYPHKNKEETVEK